MGHMKPLKVCIAGLEADISVIMGINELPFATGNRMKYQPDQFSF